MHPKGLTTFEKRNQIGTGLHTVKVNLTRSIPHIVPFHGVKVKYTYNGVKKRWKNCYEYHLAKRTEEKTSKRT